MRHRKILEPEALECVRQPMPRLGFPADARNFAGGRSKMPESVRENLAGLRGPGGACCRHPKLQRGSEARCKSGADAGSPPSLRFAVPSTIRWPRNKLNFHHIVCYVKQRQLVV